MNLLHATRIGTLSAALMFALSARPAPSIRRRD